MAPLIELERAYLKARRDRGYQRQLADLLRDYAGRPTPLYFARRLTEHVGGARIYLKREDLCHTGAHKINNVLGQGAAGRTHEEGTAHRRDRRRPARRGHGDGGRAARPGVRGLHGQRGRRAASAERLPHAAPGRAGHSGGGGQSHAQGRHQRGIARLGDERADHVLSARLRARAPSLPDDGAGPPGGDRPRGASAGPPSPGPAPGRGGGLRGRRLERYRPFLSFCGGSASAYRGRGGREGMGSPPAAMGRALGRSGGRAARLHDVPAPGRRWADQPRAFDLGGPRLSWGRAGARVLQGSRTLRVHLGDRRRGPGRLPGAEPPRGHHASAGVGPRGGLRHAIGQGADRSRAIVVGLSGRGDKDVQVVAKALGVGMP